jgi:hypothetical protein
VRSVHIGLLAIGVFSVVGFQAIAQPRPPGAMPVGGLTPAQQIAFNNAARDRFVALAPGQLAQVLAFLRSL